MKRCLVQVVLGLVLLGACAAVTAEDTHQWETATVISQKLNSDSNMVILDTGGYRYEWQESTASPGWQNFIVLTSPKQVHEQVKFYRDGKWFVVLDSQGREHEFSLVRAMKFQ
jgi:hypothetical protein